jgi:ABC-type transport system substrate-binding protein
MEFEADTSYYRGRPAIERVVAKFGQEPLPELLSGAVDAAQIQPVDALRLREDPRFHIAVQEITGYMVQIYWNLRHPVAGDPAVRRAATMAIDREELANALSVPGRMTITDVPITPGLESERPEPLPYDPDAASRVLEKAGWRDIDSDGIRERGGERLSIRLITEIPSVAVYVQQRLADVGMEIQTDVRPSTGMVWPSLRATDFEAALTWFAGGDMLGPESVLGYDVPEVASLLALRDSTPDPTARDSLLRESWPYLQRDLPITYLYPYVIAWALTNRLRGLQGPHRGNPLQAIGDLWLEDSE